MKIAPIEQAVLRATGAESISNAVRALVDRYCGTCRIGRTEELRRIAHGMGVNSITVQGLNCEAILLRSSDGYEVKLNSNASPMRQRFSLAHEVGHIILHEVEPATRTVEARGLIHPLGHPAEERICDMLAAEILMPAESIRRQFTTGSNLLVEVLRLSSLFLTSVSAMARRLDELTIVSGLALFTVVQDGVSFRISAVQYNGNPGTIQLGPWRTCAPARESIAKRAIASGWTWIPFKRRSFQLDHASTSHDYFHLIKRRMFADAMNGRQPETALVLARSAR